MNAADARYWAPVAEDVRRDEAKRIMAASSYKFAYPKKKRGASPAKGQPPRQGSEFHDAAKRDA